MENALPIIEIEGTKFIVDVTEDVLKQVDNPENTIWFPHMTDKITHYVLRYDLEKKTRLPYSTDTTIEVNIPTLISLDPQGMAETYGVGIKDLSGKTDYEIIVDQKNLDLRLKGNKPEIDIAGDIFIIDMEQEVLQLKSNLQKTISFGDFDYDGRVEQLEAFYNMKTKELVGFDSKMTTLPKDVVKVVIPEEVQLDPVYSAIEFNQDFRSFLRNKPILLQQKAIVISLENTFLMDIVSENRRLQQTGKPPLSDKLKQKGTKKKKGLKP